MAPAVVSVQYQITADHRDQQGIIRAGKDTTQESRAVWAYNARSAWDQTVQGSPHTITTANVEPVITVTGITKWAT